MSEATYDPDIAGRSQIRTMGQGGDWHLQEERRIRRRE